MANSSGKIEWFIHDGEREIGPLGEVELRKRLKRANREKLRVRQNDGPWYPAKVVIRKFRELAENGIYIKLATVAGPYTAEKAFLLLRNLSLQGVTAKIGLHGQWVSAERLYVRLQKAIDKADAPADATISIDHAATIVESDDEIIPLDPIADVEGIVALLPSEGDEIISLDPIGGVDDKLLPLELIDDDDDDLFDLSSKAAVPLVEPLGDVEPLADDDHVPVVEPIVDEQIPMVEPIAEDSIPVVQPIDSVPMVQPIEVQSVPVRPVSVQPITVQPVSVQPITVQPTTVQPITVQPITVQPQPANPLTHWCACGREVRVLPQHAGMTMQCPACQRTFVAGGRPSGR